MVQTIPTNWTRKARNIVDSNDKILQSQIDNIGKKSTIDEVVQSRVGTNGTNYDWLYQRLNAEFNHLKNTKVDRAILNGSTIEFYSDDKLVSILDITEASNAQAVQDYIDTLVSQGTIEGVTLEKGGITEEYIALKAVANDALKNAVVGKNLFNKNHVTNTLIGMQTGEEYANNTYYSSDYMPVKPNTQYSPRYECRVIWYKEKGVFLSSAGQENPSPDISDLGTPVQSPQDAKYARISFKSSDPNMLERFQFEEGEDITEPSPHYYELKNTVSLEKERVTANSYEVVYNNDGRVSKVIEGHLTTNLFYEGGEISHIIIVDAQLGTSKRIDFEFTEDKLSKVKERFI